MSYDAAAICLKGIKAKTNFKYAEHESVTKPVRAWTPGQTA